MTEQHYPIDVVLAFCRAWDRLDMDEICALLADNIHYHNVPMEPLHGKSAVAAYLKSLDAIEACSWELLSIAASGATVLTERIDRFVVRGTAVTLPVMGAFVVENGLICQWRDYFDLASYQAQWPQAKPA
ncbi:hypothetical protein IP81_04970 [Novosphingobium sp. AAP83]|uniref:limonene-1,2-epoxide hydrolase family protein n=1 Tax=Novosphingobium sp. AAP83 TaxID=1523425 RepID=UPI0006CCBD51|nr:limonene-1,2-epoxide hydrolase family protein [Novosphingobium sp. AAP83]KPF92939.1 hypothetical protein IP81_04970 [Novosphingobium sp. AAP83]